jgi:3-phytase/alkaline phosphatase D
MGIPRKSVHVSNLFFGDPTRELSIMPTHPRTRSILSTLSFVTILIALLAIGSARAPRVSADARADKVTLAGYELIGTLNFPTGYQFAGTQLGGLSSITYDASRGVYYALSDDQSQLNPARYYTLAIDLSDGQLDPGDIAFTNVTTLRDQNGQPYPLRSLDPEGMVLARPGQLFISSEGIANAIPPLNPFVNRYNLNGRQTKAAPVPEKFLPDAATQGVRTNLAFESLNVSPNRRYLYTAPEGALVQDGPAANLGVSSNARILEYDLSQLRPGREFVYVVNPVPHVPVPPTAFRVNGLVELLPLDNAGTMLALERAFSVGVGNTVHLYQIDTDGATDVSHDFALPSSFVPVAKQFVLDVLGDLGIVPDNLEGMAFGPPLPDGRLPLILVSDNNFDPAAVTQFIVLAVTLQDVP